MGILKKSLLGRAKTNPSKLNSEYQETQTFTKRPKINSNHSNPLNQRSSNLSLINYHPAPNTCLTTYPPDTHNFPFPTRRTFLTLNPPNVLDPTWTTRNFSHLSETEKTATTTTPTRQRENYKKKKEKTSDTSSSVDKARENSCLHMQGRTHRVK